ncbi:hypothetical protein [Hydrogenivirga sp.]
MNRWGRVLKALCEESATEGIELHILEADGELNWYGVSLKEVCSEENYSKTDGELYREIKGRVSDQVAGGGFIAYVSPVNLQVDIYESDRRMFSTAGTSRPFAVTKDGFRVGFFKDRDTAVDLFLRVKKRLEEEGLTLHLFY